MGSCGCGDARYNRGFRLPGGTRVGIGIYPVCRYCSTGPGVTIATFNAKGAREWMETVRLPARAVDEYGGDDGYPFTVCLFEMEDVLAECRELEAETGMESYDCIADWLEDHGLSLIQGAIERFDARRRNKSKP